MLRWLIIIIFFGLVAVVTLPFLSSSLLIDSRGITIPGTVYAKREDVTVSHASWKRTSEMTVEYSKPDGSGVAFFKVPLLPAEYDKMGIGQVVDVHYLRPQDVPDVPLAKLLRHSQLLPTARLASLHTFSSLRTKVTLQALAWLKIAGAVLLLLLVWRAAKVPGFRWAFGVCVLLGLAAFLIAGFPTETPKPLADVQQAEGRIKSVDLIETLFESSRSEGVRIDQPIEVVGVEFVPMGQKEAVLAVDLMDARSVPGLKEHSSVTLDYERLSPRTAYVRGASRQFVSRNIFGLGKDAILCLAVIAVILAVSTLLGRGYRRLVQRRS